MKNKRLFILFFNIFLVLMIAMLSLMTACAPAPPEPANLTLLGKTAGSTAHLEVSAVGEAIMRAAPNYMITTLTGSDKTSALLLEERKADLAGIATTTSVHAERGEPPFEKAIADLRLIGPYKVTTMQMVVLAKTGLTSIKDIKDQKYPLRLGTQRMGSSPEQNAKAMLEGYGITYADFESWGGSHEYYPKSSALYTALGDRLIDGFFWMAAVPDVRLPELAKRLDLRFLGMDETTAKEVADRTGLTVSTITTSQYPTILKGDVVTLSDVMVIMTHSDVSDEVAYTAAKALWTQIEYLTTVHIQFKIAIVPEVISSVSEKLHLHPGAEKFWKEVGVIK